jgi:hypothetical protein
MCFQDKTHATQMFKTLTNTLHGDVLYEVFTILFCFILLWFILFHSYDLLLIFSFISKILKIINVTKSGIFRFQFCIFNSCVIRVIPSIVYVLVICIVQNTYKYTTWRCVARSVYNFILFYFIMIYFILFSWFIYRN